MASKIAKQKGKNMKQRTITKVTSSPIHQGFLGEGHLASAVVDGENFKETDPFIILMDDRLDLPGGEPVGGPHPHAGFETVTFIVQGNGEDWKTGGLELMTAGKGVVHTEEITTPQQVRILQLWLALPPELRWTEPSVQKLDPEAVPTIKTEKSEIRVYSGTSNGLTSPLQNKTPFTLVEFSLRENAEIVQDIHETYNGFIYVLAGSVHVGDTIVKEGETGWLSSGNEIAFRTTDDSARFVLYASKPHGAPIVSHGPFIGDNEDDIRRLYREYRQGLMPHVNDLEDGKRKTYSVVEA